MEAHKATIPDIFKKSILIEVPFQRQYVWNDELWSRFIEDMEFVVQTDRSHFPGAMILKAGRKNLARSSLNAIRLLMGNSSLISREADGI